MKFERDKEYKLKYTEAVPLKVWRGTTIVSEIEYIIIKAMFTYIGLRGKKLHFFSQTLGKDLCLSKQEAINYLIKEENEIIN